METTEKSIKWNRKVAWIKKKKTRNLKRYRAYFASSREPELQEQFQNYIRRIEKLQKDLISLGSIPTRDVQIIKTVQYLVRFIGIVTSFVDEGLVAWIPDGKVEAMRDFNDTVFSATCRGKGVIQIKNETKKGQKVSYNNLFIGMYTKIELEKIKQDTKVKYFDGTPYRVDVEYASVADWLNGRVKNVRGQKVKINQKELAKSEETLAAILYASICDALKN